MIFCDIADHKAECVYTVNFLVKGIKILNNNNSLSLELWKEIFVSVSQQVYHAEIDPPADQLKIFIKERAEPLLVTHDELDDALNNSGNDCQSVVHSFLKKNKVLIIYKNTLVCFFDIQAYSSFIDRTNFRDTVWKTNNLISAIKSSAKTDILGVKFDCWICSDSIISVIDTTRSALFSGSLEFFLGTCSMIMAVAIKNGFPLRGAIGGGDFFKDGELMVSSALVDAARHEKKQNWLGAVLTPNAKTLIARAGIDLSSDKFKSFLRYGKIPWKKSNDSSLPQEGHYVKPWMVDNNWACNHLLLTNFEDRDGRVTNSHCLYGEE